MGYLMDQDANKFQKDIELIEQGNRLLDFKVENDKKLDEYISAVKILAEHGKKEATDGNYEMSDHLIACSEYFLNKTRVLHCRSCEITDLVAEQINEYNRNIDGGR